MAKALLAIALSLIFASSSVLAAGPKKKQPSWDELSREQQQVLAPLAPDWNNFSARRKRKWLGIAERYPVMEPLEQAKVQRKMRPWSKLTPEQRRAARKRFKKLQELATQKQQSLSEKWEEYRRIPEAERKQFEAAGKAPKKVRESSKRRAKKKARTRASAPPTSASTSATTE